MQKLTIFEKDINYIQNIISNSSIKINNLKLYNFHTYEDKKMYATISSQESDILIIKFDLLRIKIINYIINNNLYFYINSIIIIYDSIDKIKDFLNNENRKFIFKCINKSNDLSLLICTLNSLTNIKELNFDKRILINKIEKLFIYIGLDIKKVKLRFTL